MISMNGTLVIGPLGSCATLPRSQGTKDEAVVAKLLFHLVVSQRVMCVRNIQAFLLIVDGHLPLAQGAVNRCKSIIALVLVQSCRAMPDTLASWSCHFL